MHIHWHILWYHLCSGQGNDEINSVCVCVCIYISPPPVVHAYIENNKYLKVRYIHMLLVCNVLAVSIEWRSSYWISDSAHWVWSRAWWNCIVGILVLLPGTWGSGMTLGNVPSHWTEHKQSSTSCCSVMTADDYRSLTSIVHPLLLAVIITVFAHGLPLEAVQHSRFVYHHIMFANVRLCPHLPRPPHTFFNVTLWSCNLCRNSWWWELYILPYQSVPFKCLHQFFCSWCKLDCI